MNYTAPIYAAPVKRKRNIASWHIAALLFVCLDGLTTTFAMLEIAGAAERNPMIAAVIAQVGVVPTMLAKIAIGTAMAYWLGYCAEHGYPWRWMQRNWRFKHVPRQSTTNRGYYLLITMTILHLIVVINNTAIIITRS